MRIHVQNSGGDSGSAVTPEQFRQAAEQAGEPDHAVSFGAAPADFAAAQAELELLVTTPRVLRTLLPLDAPRLRLVFVLAAGVDGLAPFDWLPASVALLNNRGVHAAKAGEYIAMAALMLAARVPLFASAQRAGHWHPVFTGPLARSRVAIVGVGDLGSAGARALRALGVAVTGVRTTGLAHPDFASVVAVAGLDALLPELDMLLLACPLTPATAGLLDRRRLALLPPGAGVANLGRGRLLDQAALCDSLDAGHLSGVVLDVFDPEPPPPDHRLWRTRNLIVTPHVSCDDPASYNPLSLGLLFANLRAWREGRALPNRVDVARGY